MFCTDTGTSVGVAVTVCVDVLGLISSAKSKDYFASRKKKVQLSMAIGHGELVHECFPIAWEQQEQNKTKKQTTKVRREA